MGKEVVRSKGKNKIQNVDVSELIEKVDPYIHGTLLIHLLNNHAVTNKAQPPQRQILDEASAAIKEISGVTTSENTGVDEILKEINPKMYTKLTLHLLVEHAKTPKITLEKLTALRKAQMVVNYLNGNKLNLENSGLTLEDATLIGLIF